MASPVLKITRSLRQRVCGCPLPPCFCRGVWLYKWPVLGQAFCERILQAGAVCAAGDLLALRHLLGSTAHPAAACPPCPRRLELYVQRETWERLGGCGARRRCERRQRPEGCWMGMLRICSQAGTLPTCRLPQREPGARAVATAPATQPAHARTNRPLPAGGAAMPCSQRCAGWSDACWRSWQPPISGACSTLRGACRREPPRCLRSRCWQMQARWAMRACRAVWECTEHAAVWAASCGCTRQTGTGPAGPT